MPFALSPKEGRRRHVGASQSLWRLLVSPARQRSVSAHGDDARGVALADLAHCVLRNAGHPQ
eukprot:2179625-Rhodomonas_salina.1